MTYWTLTYSGTEKTLAEWGIINPRLTFTNNGVDRLEFELVEAFDGADVFAFGAQVTLRKGRELVGGVFGGGTQWFVGEISKTPRSLTPDGEAHGYAAEGPLAWLAEVMYGQSWYQAGGSLKTTHVLLNRGLRTDQQIADALQAAILAGMPAQIGTIDTLTAVPMSEGRDMTCSEVIAKMLRWSPDAVLWVDYATTPPTINCRRYANLAAVSASVGGDKLAAANIRPRQDLVLPGVVLNFETVSEVDGEARMVLSQQKCPDGTYPPGKPAISGFERRCLVATFDLEGPKVTHQFAALETAPILANDADATKRLNWWKAHEPALAHATVAGLAINPAWVKFWTSKWGNGPQDWAVGAFARRVDGAETSYYKALHALTDYNGDPANDAANWELQVVPPGSYQDTWTVMSELTWSSYPRKRELVAGVWPEWLEAQGYSAERIIVTATADYSVTAPTGQSFWEGGHPVKIELVATDAPTGVYSALESYMSGETEPAGLARFLYDTHAILHYQGQITLTEEECGGTVRPGMRLNVTGGTGAFAGMNAVVQEAAENLESGETEVSFGPPKWLGPGDIIEWLRAWRTRRIWTNPATQDDGRYAAEAKVASGKQAPSPNSGGGLGWATKLVLNGSGGTIKIDQADANGKTLEVRELDYCDSGTVKKIMVLASAPYVP